MKKNILSNITLFVCICIISTGIVLLTNGCCKKATGPDTQDSTFAEKVERILNDKLALCEVNGVTVFVRNNDGEICNIGAGLADVQNNIAMHEDTKMRIASISKTFLATVVLQLWEEGLLDIDHLMSQYLPDSTVAMFPYGEQVTLRQLLNHTSGIYDFEDDNFLYNLMIDPLYHWTPNELLEYAVNSPSSIHNEPGTLFSYSNTNYILLGLIVESVTGISMEQNIRDRILDPFELGNTYSGNEDIPQDNYSIGYQAIDDSTEFIVCDETLPLYFEWAHGQMVSTPEDLWGFLNALSSGELFSQEATLNAMLAFTPISNFSYGLGMLNFGEEIGFGHTGGTLGFFSCAMINPATSTALILIYNTYNNECMGAAVGAILGIM